MSLLNRLKTKVFVAAVVSVIWLAVATHELWGYDVLDSRVQMTTVRLGISVIKYQINDSVTVTLNSLLFPRNHVAGARIMTSDFPYETPELFVTDGGGLQATASGGREGSLADTTYIVRSTEAVVFGELGKNLPLFFLGSLLVLHVFDKIIDLSRRPDESRSNETTQN